MARNGSIKERGLGVLRGTAPNVAAIICLGILALPAIAAM